MLLRDGHVTRSALGVRIKDVQRAAPGGPGRSQAERAAPAAPSSRGWSPGGRRQGRPRAGGRRPRPSRARPSSARRSCSGWRAPPGWAGRVTLRVQRDGKPFDVKVTLGQLPDAAGRGRRSSPSGAGTSYYRRTVSPAALRPTSPRRRVARPAAADAAAAACAGEYPRRPQRPTSKAGTGRKKRRKTVRSSRRRRPATRRRFRKLVERHQRRAFAIALALVRDENDARELVQDAFLRVFKSLGASREGRASSPGSTASSRTSASTSSASPAGRRNDLDEEARLEHRRRASRRRPALPQPLRRRRPRRRRASARDRGAAPDGARRACRATTGRHRDARDRGSELRGDGAGHGRLRRGPS